jgi:integrase
MNDVLLNSKKIGQYLGEQQRAHIDRAYTIEEISKLLSAADERTKVIVSLLASTGMRIGALPALKIKHLHYINIKEYQLYQILVYEGHRQAYYTYCTPECAKYIDSYLQYRERCGEKLNSQSPLIREQFDSDDVLRARLPRHTTLGAITQLLDKLLFKSGVQTVVHRTENQTKSAHKDVARAHGFRKFANTNMVMAKVNPAIKEMLFGHRASIGLDDNYFRPSPDEILKEYLKAVDLLTINESNRLKRKVEQLSKEQSEIEIMRLKHEQEIKEMKSRLAAQEQQQEQANKKYQDMMDSLREQQQQQFSKVFHRVKEQMNEMEMSFKELAMKKERERR